MTHNVWANRLPWSEQAANGKAVRLSDLLYFITSGIWKYFERNSSPLNPIWNGR